MVSLSWLVDEIARPAITASTAASWIPVFVVVLVETAVAKFTLV
jgi:hypothetical protein